MRARVVLCVVCALTLVLAAGAPALAADFPDVQGSPYENSIDILVDRSIVGGYPDGTFRPDNPLQRQQFAKMAVLTMGHGVIGEDVSTFPDTPAPFDPVNNPLYPGSYVAVAAQNGIILGKADGTFDFYGQVTRQQAVTIVVRAAGEELAEPSSGYEGHLSYTDPTHGANLKKAEFNGLLDAIPALSSWDPTSPATRGEAAELLAQLLAIREGRSLDPAVSTAWLEDHLTMDGLVIIDIRAADSYAVGHVPGAINIPTGFSVHTEPEYMVPGELYMEVPSQQDLFKLIGDAGIAGDSRVVVVGGLDPLPSSGLIAATRVADTLVYAGVKDVAILDGAFPTWATEGREVTTTVPTVTATTYSETVDAGMIVSTEYVKGKIGQAVILDTRQTSAYSGAMTEPWVGKPGHIPTALSLPAGLIWEADWTYRPVQALKQAVAAVFTAEKSDEIIVYCAVGASASSWWYVLTQMLGYSNVKLYDGAAQAWAVDNDMVVAD